MPGRGYKRSLEEIVAAEDSNDDDYDDHAPSATRPHRHRSRRAGSANPARKKQRRVGYRGSDISDDDEDEEEEEWTDEAETEEVETNERGRPVRRSVKKAITYEESESDEDELHDSATDSDRATTPPPPRRRGRKIVTLKISTPIGATSGRPMRKTSASYSGKQPLTATAPTSSGTRRSHRHSLDDEEPLIELSNSGRHANIVRPGSREPDESTPRPIKGGKGIKHPSKSTIDEAEDEDENEAFESIPKAEEEDEPMEIKASQHDIPEDELVGENEGIPQILTDLPAAAEAQLDADIGTHDPVYQAPQLEEEDPEVAARINDAEDEDDEDMPVMRGRLPRTTSKRQANSPPQDEPEPTRRRLRNRKDKDDKRKRLDESSDFDPENDQDAAEEMSASSGSDISPQKGNSLRPPDDYDSSNGGGRRSTRLRSKVASRNASGSDDDEQIADELAEELAELKKDDKRRRSLREQIVYEPRGRRGGRKDYNLLKNLQPIEEDDEPAAPSPSARARKGGGGGGWHRNLFSTYGPFGGAGGPAPVLGGPVRPAPDADSDSSDDEIMKQPKPSIGGAVGMTPTTATAPFNPFAMQPLNSDPAQGPAGTPANLGKIKDKQALADADPLGVDQNVDFDSVGGLQGHIDQLKEMVALPLLYPEIFMRFKITPPRGVLFHGPPGTGKTLLARALATSVSTQGRKVTFYMRKGADALSKWVGEAERQLRLLFEEARKNQPSIIFFDEIDGLAPVRSSKQEQIHASIVSTLLALMDGMDGRGQVIVIGATNRPDSIDPALRRPGRFDREFYFPLPDTDARRSIINIHTRGWDPPLPETIKDELAEMTKGYGGADLRALCTEAALNAVQRQYPQIYRSKEKLLIDPKTIEVMPKDFMISIKKMTPSSERSASSGASPLPPSVRPLLQRAVAEIEKLVAEILPTQKKTTALEEAMFEDVADGQDFGRERIQQAFETSRIFRPRLLISGKIGMGQQYVAAALLHHFQGVHVQNFDLSTLLSDTTSSPEATVIRLFSEVKMHKPSVIFVPNVQEWYSTVGTTVLSTFFGLLRAIKPTDPVLVLGFSECEADQEDEGMKKELFGYSKRNQYLLRNPSHRERAEFFSPLRDYIRTRPNEFPDPAKRQKRLLAVLPPAPPEAPKAPPPLSKEQLKAQKKKDRQTLNLLKIRLQPIMDQIRTRYKKFRTGVIDESLIRYLMDEADPTTVTSDVAIDRPSHAQFRPFEIGKDAHGVPGLVEVGTGKFFYNIDSVTIEKRLSNGYYKRPKDYLADIKRLAKDAKMIEDEDRLLKANELLANVEVDITGIEMGEPILAAECERVYQRELAREKEAQEQQNLAGSTMPPPRITAAGVMTSLTTTDEPGQIRLGETFDDPKDMMIRPAPSTPIRASSSASHQTNGLSAEQLRITHHPTDSISGNEADNEGDTSMLDSHQTSHDRSNETQKTNHTTTSSSFNAHELNRGSAQPRPFHSYTAPSQQLRQEAGMSAPLSQTGFMTPMQAGSQAADYLNEASTTQTTSGQKQQQQNSSGERANNTQESGPNVYIFDERRSGGTDIPDTQDNPPYSQNSLNGSSQSQQVSKAIAPPPLPAHTSTGTDLVRQTTSTSNGTALADLLNPASEATKSNTTPNLVLPSSTELDHFHTDLTDKASGLTVEQLEQVNSVLMDVIWRTRGEWDRRKVLTEVVAGFNDTLQDMRDVGQDLGVLSWEGRSSKRA